MADATLTIDSSQFVAALKQIQERQATVNALVKSFGPDAAKAYTVAERTAKRAADGPSAWTLALQANTKALADQHGAINKAKEATGALGAALSLVSPELATLAGGFQKAEGAAGAMAGAAEILGASLGAVALAAGPVLAVGATLGYMFHEQAEYQKEVAKRTEDYAAALGGLKKAMADLNEQADALTIREGLLTGEYTEQEAAAERAKNAALKATQAQRDASTQELQALQDRLAAIRVAEREGSGLKGLFGGTSAADLARESQDVKRQIGTLTEALDELDQKALAVADTEVRVTAGEAKHKDAVKASASAVRDLEAAEKALDQTAREAAERQGKLDREAVERNAAILAANGAAREKAFLDDQALTAAQVASYQAAGDAREEQILRDLELTQRLNAEQVAAAQQTATEISGAYSMTSAALGDYFDSVLDARKDKIGELEEAIKEANENGEQSKAASLQKQLAAEKEAATKAFRWQQALSASNATVNWLEALVKATTYGPVGGPLVAGAATLAYGLSLKQIEAEQPTFTDTPAGGYRMGPESQTVRGAPNDTAILFRDPLEGFAQAVEVMARRQAPTSTPKRGGRSLLGVSAATTPVSRLLTRDVERATRGKL